MKLEKYVRSITDYELVDTRDKEFLDATIEEIITAFNSVTR